jgi:hypothetical protein
MLDPDQSNRIVVFWHIILLIVIRESVKDRKGLANIVDQYNLLPRSQHCLWFYVNTGLRTTMGTGLEPISKHCASELRIQAHDSAVIDNQQNYSWVSDNTGSWIISECLKTVGVCCISAAVTNTLNASPSDCNALFSYLLPLHLANGEVNVGKALNRAQQFSHNIFRFQFFKMKRLISFLQFHESKEFYVGLEDVVVVCYKTTTNCTHAISWHIGAKHILDSDMSNRNVLTYTNFNSDSTDCLQMLHTLNTTMNDPCILYIGRWDRKVLKKRVEISRSLEAFKQKKTKG